MSTQRPTQRRRSARLAFGSAEQASRRLMDENGAPAAKRSRKDGGPGAGAGKGGGDAASQKRAVSLSYDEEDDGFLFTRTRSKKSKAVQAAVPASVPEEEVPSLSAPTRTAAAAAAAPATMKTAATATATVAKTATSTRRKNAGVGAASKTVDKEVLKPRRRSARVAGDTRPEGAQDHARTREHEPPAIRDSSHEEARDARIERPREVAKETANGDGLHVAADVAAEHGDATSPAKDADATRIALPLADTPVIKRNKEFREQGSRRQHRRSSAALRGRRASSLMESGSDALPHRQVDSTEFYKHIAGEGQSEARRLKQLLVWCGTRALEDEQAADQADQADQGGTGTLSVVLQGLLKEITQCDDISDWFIQADQAAAPTVIKKPNPRNEANAQKIEELEKQVYALQAERQSWEAFFAEPVLSAASDLPLPPPPPSPAPPSSLPSAIDPNLLASDSQRTILHALLTRPPPPPESTTTDATGTDRTTAALLSTQLSSLASHLEPTIDRIADGVYKLEQYRATAERVADSALAAVAARLQARDQAQRERAGTSEVPLLEVLRGLGRVADR
ncbi:MAG: hypothetical protein M1826_004266 [Phylliscum demangeonii]|nr:MAG: hypothetical protein M1826_004266 [Phylliscum demangeonii]